MHTYAHMHTNDIQLFVHNTFNNIGRVLSTYNIKLVGIPVMKCLASCPVMDVGLKTPGLYCIPRKCRKVMFDKPDVIS